jgi:hypothetical protein
MGNQSKEGWERGIGNQSKEGCRGLVGSEPTQREGARGGDPGRAAEHHDTP